MSAALKIYCDTSTLAPNIRDSKSQPELTALQQLRLLRKQGKCVLLRSHIVRGELERTKNATLRERLKADFDALEGILNDEKLIGFNTVYDQYGGFTTNPLIEDIQDATIFNEIYQEIKQRVSRATDFQMRRDAEHLTQAICNECDVFLTRDHKTIIGPMRDWLEVRYPRLRIRLPSELLAEMERTARTTSRGSSTRTPPARR
jgi:hypothetical protein